MRVLQSIIVNIFTYIDSLFGYWNPMEFIPKHCLINLLYLIGMRKKNDGGIGEDGREVIKKRKSDKSP